MGSLPTGTVTFLFTDIEGSTTLWERNPEAMEDALQIHNAILRHAIESNGGVAFKIIGDEFQAAFSTAPQALSAAIEAQRGLIAAIWNELGPLRVRMGFHTGEAHLDEHGDEYAVSHTKNRGHRVMEAGHGGQILLSQESAELCKRSLSSSVDLKDLGEHRVKGMVLPEHLYQVIAIDLPQDFPPLRTQTPAKNNLPRQLTSFIGREKEITQVKDLLEMYSIVTLTGAGGVGKTRLALQVAREVLVRFPEGVWLVELATLTDATLLPEMVATRLGLRLDSARPPIELLVAYFGTRHTLLILDNCEHLIEACANFVESLIQGCSKLEILATSREPLGVAGEASFYVPSLSVPILRDLHILEQVQLSDATRLFADRANAVLPAFQIAEHNALALTRICSRLDGIPLAIELAAARVNLLTPEQLADRLEHSFTVLSSGPRTSLPRHQTLRAVIDWSYNLLSNSERILLHRLSVFSGSWQLEAAERVCGWDGIECTSVLELLASLVSKSIVLAERVEGGEMRYRLLETVRQYAREKLIQVNEEHVVQTLHRDYFLWLAEQAEPRLRSSERMVWTRKLKYENDNFRLALKWSIEETDGLLPALRILVALYYRFWEPQGYIAQPHEWLVKGLALARKDASVSRLLLAQIISLTIWGSNQYTHELVDECVKICQEIGPDANYVLCRCLSIAAFAASTFQDEIEACKIWGEKCLKIIQLLDSTYVWDKAMALTLVSRAYVNFSYDYEVVQGYALEALNLFQRSGDRDNGPLITLGHISMMKGDFNKAISYFEDAIAICEEVDDKSGKGYPLTYLGNIELLRGNFPTAKRYFKELLIIMFEILVIEGLVYSLGFLGITNVLQGQSLANLSRKNKFLRACQYFGAIESVDGEKIIKKVTILKDYYKAAIDILNNELPLDDLNAAWKVGSKMSPDEAVKFAFLEEE